MTDIRIATEDLSSLASAQTALRRETANFGRSLVEGALTIEGIQKATDFVQSILARGQKPGAPPSAPQVAVSALSASLKVGAATLAVTRNPLLAGAAVLATLPPAAAALAGEGDRREQLKQLREVLIQNRRSRFRASLDAATRVGSNREFLRQREIKALLRRATRGR